MNVCELCGAYIANFEVHSCWKFGNQHRQSSQPFLDLFLISGLKILIPYQRSNITMKHNGHFCVKAILQRNKTFFPTCSKELTVERRQLLRHFPSVQSQAKILKLLIFGFLTGRMIKKDSLNQYTCNIHLKRLKPYFWLTFNRRLVKRHALTNQLAPPLNASRQMECSGISRTDEMSEQFTSDFNENFDASANRISPQYEIPSGIPILTIPNAQYYAMDLITQTDSTVTIHSNKCAKRISTER
ncbi:hypothetical protein CEXT_798381 [Caerostris extrusa]|uniref:Uncharacterized protein n=1 Tax=Caerostris extrusa TaxID=172846 RepID=A0AAV4WVQ8_CAEEX|nr:hypothetical protein CEXT_798381 [Caerostris extrusa]